MDKLEFESLRRVADNGCWLWQGRLDSSGYGRLDWQGKNSYAHRVAAELAGIDTSAVIMHTCNVRRCCNPSHLKAGTQTENNAQCVRDGRSRNGNTQKTHCKRGHEFTPENTYYNPSDPGNRICRACTRKDPARRRRGHT